MADLNCDMGEGMAGEERIMPFIRSANISCGYHAGDAATIRDTIRLALKHGVKIGAHPSFDDRENFGRKMQDLPANEIIELVRTQLEWLTALVKEEGGQLVHVKPHGALYNLSAKDPEVAKAIATAVRNFDSRLVLFGLSGSLSIDAANEMGLQAMHEAFADRTYEDDGSLTPRSMEGSMINDARQMLEQVDQLIKGEVRSRSGKKIRLSVDTICIHGDGPNAAEFASLIASKLT